MTSPRISCRDTRNFMDFPGGTGYTAVSPTTPTTFETVSPGQFLEVEPVIGFDGVHIDLNIAPEHIERRSSQVFALPKDKAIAGATGRDVRPRSYFYMKTTTSLTLLSCRHALVGVFQKEKLQGTVEIFIIGAEAIDMSPNPQSK